MAPMSLRARAFIGVYLCLGAAVLAIGASQWATADAVRFFFYLLVAVMASGLKVKLPGIEGTMSVNFLFILICIVELGFAETLAISCIATVVQSLWKAKRRLHLVQVLFNIANLATAVTAAYAVHHRGLANMLGGSFPLLLIATASTYFVTNTVPVAAIISLTEEKRLSKIWKECYFWSLPYYLLGAAIAGAVSFVNRHVGWQLSLLVFPVFYTIYRSYGLYLERLENEKRHAEDLADLHQRTIEALALAIEAKDQTTHDHLQRVRIYALEIGKDLGLPETEMDALRAAAVLHDIGKLAVPEHILCKPGRLTPEEFEKMKTHPIVGAEILEQVKFTCPVVPIVLSHHEKWNGKGYPYGLKGEEIPLGARILSAVDFLDALSSNRQYRPALSLDEAMKKLELEAGRSFDPKVVEVLKLRYQELELMARSQPAPLKKQVCKKLKTENTAAPAAGFAAGEVSHTEAEQPAFVSSIAAARQEAQMLFELSQSLGSSLSVDETLSVLSVRLKKLVPYDSIAIYVRGDDHLVPQYVNGEDFRLFSSLKIPMGKGVSGWVAQSQRPILNGNPSVEFGGRDDIGNLSTLHSALAVPLLGLREVVGVLALYQREKDAFNSDHLRILMAISSKVGLCLENGLKYRLAEDSATTDYLTGLPNARSLFLHLDQELARCKRDNTPLAVLVCDLNGFKQINDRFGHLEGNQVLRYIATGMQACCREYDYVARMGGDEFVLVAPGLTSEALNTKIGQLNQVAVETGRKICGFDVLSVSVGAAFSPVDGTDAEQLLAEADRRMYAKKQDHHTRVPSRVPGLKPDCLPARVM